MSAVCAAGPLQHRKRENVMPEVGEKFTIKWRDGSVYRYRCEGVISSVLPNG